LNSDDNEIDEIDEEEEDLEEFDDGEVINLRFFNFGDPEALSEYISSFFTSPKDRLKVTRRYIVAKFNAKDTVQERSKIIRVSFPSAFEVFSYELCVHRAFPLLRTRKKPHTSQLGFKLRLSTTRRNLKSRHRQLS
jgi:hypothetical protein